MDLQGSYILALLGSDLSNLCTNMNKVSNTIKITVINLSFFCLH